jgi:hypothetical protein
VNDGQIDVVEIGQTVISDELQEEPYVTFIRSSGVVG